MEHKTNVMRILEQKKIPYKHYSYEGSGIISGVEVATYLHQNPSQVFKTLVTISKNKTYYVFLVPSNKELDLKKAAKSIKAKSIEMIKSKDLLNVAGYIHGGCSPIGMKKTYKTVIDESAKDFDTIIYSAGKTGYQVETSLKDLKKIINFSLYNITK